MEGRMRSFTSTSLLITLTVCGLVSVATRPVAANTLAAASCARAAVAAAVASASDGDTVRIPAGTCAWTTQLDITKGIALIGDGTTRTILQDSVPKDGSFNSSLIRFVVNEPKTFRLSGLTIQGVTTDPSVFNKGHVRLAGTSKSFRIDHVSFTDQQTGGIKIEGYLFGVIDHSVFSGSYKQGVVVSHEEWGGQGFGDGSWAEQLYPGTNKAVYIEDCEFFELHPSNSSGAIDALEGARVVFRYNTLHNQNGTSHGSDSSQRSRSVRWLEVYNNNYSFDTSHVVPYVQWIRGGSGVFHSNIVSVPQSGWINKVVQTSNCRDADAGCGGPSYPPWGACDGTSPYDQNSAGNTGYRCVDQPGSGTSMLLSGNPPLPAQWVGNALEPIYVWNNVVAGASYDITLGSIHVQPGRDFVTGSSRPGYAPYVYPHPLAVGEPPGPPSPTNLHIVK